MTRRELLADAVARLEGAGIEDARRNAEWLLEDVLAVTRAALYGHPEVSVTPGEALHAEALLARRLRREPIQYVLGHAHFMDLRLRVTPDVLIPRPETEEVAEVALRCLDGTEAPWVLDVGTGSGALALALKKRRPDAEVFACDIAEGALGVAATNAEQLGLPVTFIHADVAAASFIESVAPTFDLVVSNPPYVPESEKAELEPEVRNHEPAAALFVPSGDPLRFYRILAGHAPTLLKPGGWLVVETHAVYCADVRDLFEASGLEEVSLRRDLAGRPRVVSARRGG